MSLQKLHTKGKNFAAIQFIYGMRHAFNFYRGRISRKRTECKIGPYILLCMYIPWRSGQLMYMSVVYLYKTWVIPIHRPLRDRRLGATTHSGMFIIQIGTPNKISQVPYLVDSGKNNTCVHGYGYGFASVARHVPLKASEIGALQKISFSAQHSCNLSKMLCQSTCLILPLRRPLQPSSAYWHQSAVD